MGTRSSDTPATNDPEETGPQGPADWSKEAASDDRLGDEVKGRLARLRVGHDLAQRLLLEAGEWTEGEPVRELLLEAADWIRRHVDHA